jgi:predicted AlkP superfamily pyrophosphatase or phosphodiesterase
MDSMPMRSRKTTLWTAVVCCVLFAASGGSALLQSQQAARPEPRLVLLIAVDQLRYDFLTRFRGEYTGGFDRLLRNGANYVNAHLEHYPTVTAVGHSTMGTGAFPKFSGIVGNDWYERESGKNVTSVSDDSVQLLGGPSKSAASPRRLLVSTVGDELKRARKSSKVIGISFKDRSAILPAGHMANGAYWLDSASGNFVSSTYYFPALPAWVSAFNDARPADKFAGKEWKTVPADAGLFKMPGEVGSKLYDGVYASPFGNELLESFVEEAVREEKLGQRDATDLLTVSFSSNDAIGHNFGPDSAQVHAVSVQTDQILGKLFDYLDKSVGMQHILVVLTADHGVMPLSEELQAQKMPGGRMSGPALFDPIKVALAARFGPGEWLAGPAGTSPYFNLELIREKKLDRAEVERVAAAAAAEIPHVAHVYTRTQLLLGQTPDDFVSNRVVRSFNAQRSGDLEIVLEPFWIRGASGTTHGTPYSYDSHIPLIFMGPGIEAGRYVRPAALNDLAPSLATLLDIETPNGSAGRPLAEMMTAAADR